MNFERLFESGDAHSGLLHQVSVAAYGCGRPRGAWPAPRVLVGSRPAQPLERCAVSDAGFVPTHHVVLAHAAKVACPTAPRCCPLDRAHAWLRAGGPSCGRSSSQLASRPRARVRGSAVRRMLCVRVMGQHAPTTLVRAVPIRPWLKRADTGVLHLRPGCGSVQALGQDQAGFLDLGFPCTDRRFVARLEGGGWLRVAVVEACKDRVIGNTTLRRHAIVGGEKVLEVGDRPRQTVWCRHPGGKARTRRGEAQRAANLDKLRGSQRAAVATLTLVVEGCNTIGAGRATRAHHA